MGQTAVIHSKCLQIIFSKEEFVQLAHAGEAKVRVADLGGSTFGEVKISVSDLTRAAMLEHLDMPYPARWVQKSVQGRKAGKDKE